MPSSSIRQCIFPAFSPLPSTLPFFTSLFQTSMLSSPPCERSLSCFHLSFPYVLLCRRPPLQSLPLSLRSLPVRQQVLVPPAKPPGLADKSIHHCNWFCRGSECLMRAPPPLLSLHPIFPLLRYLFRMWAPALAGFAVNGAEASMCSKILQVAGWGKGEAGEGVLRVNQSSSQGEGSVQLVN